MKFVFLGPPGAGKGTLATKVAAAYRIPHISTGDIFRAAIKDGTPLGKKVKAILDSGGLVEDSVTIALVKERLSQSDAKNGFILDGFPRTIPQAEALAGFAQIDAAVNLVIADEDVLKRLSGRRVCPSCGKNYHVEFMPPKKAGVCNECEENLFIREDDKIEAITHRLEVYYSQTAPLVDFYREKKVLVDIACRTRSEDVLAEFKILFPIESR
jgi:adenylate kinase